MYIIKINFFIVCLECVKILYYYWLFLLLFVYIVGKNCCLYEDVWCEFEIVCIFVI